MAATFMDEELFESGPYRFSLEPVGTLVVPRLASGSLTAGSLLLGGLEVAVVVRGRLVATDDAELDLALGPILAKAEHPAPTGKLVDFYGREYDGMKLVRVELGDRIDRGASVSLSYEARFLRPA